MTEPITPAYNTWTPCEDREDPTSWDNVTDEPFSGDYDDPEARDAVAD